MSTHSYSACMILVSVLAVGTPILVTGMNDDLPPLKDYGLKEYVYTSKRLPHAEAEPWTLVCRLPYNAQFTSWIKLRSDAGGNVVKFDSTNPLTFCTQKVQSYTTRAGEQAYEIPAWISGEGAKYIIPAGVEVLAVQFRETGYNTEFTGSFTCNDDDYNRLWEKATRTCYLCMREHFMDCPDRERREWLGDAVLQMEECFYAFDLSSHRIVRKMIRRRQFNRLPGQDLIAHGEYGEWGYYLYTGDLDTLKMVYPKTKAYLERYQLGDNGVPIKLKDGWDWYDWGKGHQDKTVIQAAEYYGALAGLRKMAQATGNQADLPQIDRKLKTIRENFDRVYWKGDGYRSGEQLDERANAMAVCAGLADRSKWPVITGMLEVPAEPAEHSLSKESAPEKQGTNGVCGPYFERWTLEALCRMGEEEKALLRMYRRYQAQIEANITTLYEYIVRAHEDKTGIHSVNYTTLNHGWNVPNTILSKYIAGVAPEEPGWTTWHVLPQEAFLRKVAVSVTTVKGQVEVAIEKRESEYAITLQSPPNATAIAGIPRKAFTRLDSISVNGREIWKQGPVGKVEGLTFQGEEAGYVKFSVAPGAWRLVARGSLELSTPKQPSLAVQPGGKLDKKSWKVSASIDDQTFSAGPWRRKYNVVHAGSAQAVDGDFWTGWRTMQDQVPGQWFAVDMGQVQTFDSIVLDNTWAIHDSPAAYAVYVTNDTGNWGEPVADGTGSDTGITVIRFPKQQARHIKIVQTGSKNQFWSIFEVDVCNNQ